MLRAKKKLARKKRADKPFPAVLPPRPLVVQLPPERSLLIQGQPLVEVRHAPKREDRAYLDYVKRHPCCFVRCSCHGRRNVLIDPHHYPARGMGGKNGDDRRTVPLCRRMHNHVEQHGHLPGTTVQETNDFFRSVQLTLLIAYLDGRR